MPRGGHGESGFPTGGGAAQFRHEGGVYSHGHQGGHPQTIIVENGPQPHVLPGADPANMGAGAHNNPAHQGPVTQHAPGAAHPSAAASGGLGSLFEGGMKSAIVGAIIGLILGFIFQNPLLGAAVGAVAGGIGTDGFKGIFGKIKSLWDKFTHHDSGPEPTRQQSQEQHTSQDIAPPLRTPGARNKEGVRIP